MLKTQIVDQAKKSDKLISLLHVANGNKFNSVYNWFKYPLANRLTEYKNLYIIAKFFGTTVDEIIDTENLEAETDILFKQNNLVDDNALIIN